MFRYVFPLSVVLIAGCGGGKSGEPNSATAPVPGTAATSQSAELSKQTPKPDRAKPLSEYFDVNSEPMVLTYILTAKATTPVSEEDRLRRFSTQYNNEPDVFKRKELVADELRRIDSQLNRFKSVDYFSLPVGDGYAERPIGSAVSSPVGISSLEIGAYDLERKSFPVVGGNTYCWTIPIQDAQGATLRVIPTDFPCSLPVPDEAQAKNIEAARSKNAVDPRGAVYLFAPKAEGGALTAVVVHVHLELIDSRTKAALATFDL